MIQWRYFYVNLMLFTFRSRSFAKIRDLMYQFDFVVRFKLMNLYLGRGHSCSSFGQSTQQYKCISIRGTIQPITKNNPSTLRPSCRRFYLSLGTSDLAALTRYLCYYNSSFAIILFLLNIIPVMRSHQPGYLLNTLLKYSAVGITSGNYC